MGSYEIAVSSHSFTSLCDIFFIKGVPLSVTYFLQKLHPKKKMIETSFGLFVIRIIQEADITISARKVTKEVQRSVKIPQMFPFT